MSRSGYSSSAIFYFNYPKVFTCLSGKLRTEFTGPIANCTSPQANWTWLSLPRRGEGVLGFMFAGYVPLASQSPYPIIVYFLANYRPHLSHFLENVIFAIPASSLSMYTSTLSMWLQAAECNAINVSLLLNLINNNFLIFQRRIFPFWIPTYPKSPKMCDPILVNLLKMQRHYSQSSRKNATPSSGTSLLASCKGVPPPPPGM